MVEVTGVLISFSLHRSDLLSRLWLVYWALATIVLLIVTKAIVYSILKRIAPRRLQSEGGGDRRRRAIRAVPDRTDAQPPGSRLQPGRACSTKTARSILRRSGAMRALEGVPVERDFARCSSWCATRDPRIVARACRSRRRSTIHRFVMELRNDFVNIRFIPDVRSLTLFNQPMVDLLGVPAINLAASPITDLRGAAQARVRPPVRARRADSALAPLMLVHRHRW